MTWSRRMRRGLAGASMALFSLALIGGMALAGWRMGWERGKAEQARRIQATADAAVRQAMDLLDAGQEERALAFLEAAARLRPGDPTVEAARAEAQRRIAARPTPTSLPPEILLEDAFQTARKAYEAGDLPRAVELLLQIRNRDPAFRAAEVSALLREAALRHGMQLLQDPEDRLAEGLFYLDQAARLGPLPPEAATAYRLAALYLAARDHWGVNWAEAIRRLREIYALAPGYRDTARRLFQAHVAYGDLLTAQGESCPAEAQYQAALRLFDDPAVQAKAQEAGARCLLATPTPIPGTLPGGGTPLPPPIPVGRLAYALYDSEAGTYVLYVIEASGRGFRVAVGADQPAWQPGGRRLAYRVAGVGLFIRDLESGETVQIAGPGAAWPTWAPDGQHLAFMDGAGGIRVLNLQEPGQAQRIATGRFPAWSAQGTLAWTGCAAGGCGLLLLPPGASAPVRLSQHPNDLQAAWSPDGSALVYTTDVQGNLGPGRSPPPRGLLPGAHFGRRAGDRARLVSGRGLDRLSLGRRRPMGRVSDPGRRRHPPQDPGPGGASPRSAEPAGGLGAIGGERGPSGVDPALLCG
jgi:tetratricopeptide (TPR) repeat protein